MIYTIATKYTCGSSTNIFAMVFAMKECVTYNAKFKQKYVSIPKNIYAKIVRKNMCY